MDDQKIEPKPITLQKQYDNSYTSKSNSIATSYQNAMNSYAAKSNSIAMSYQDAMNSYTTKSNSIATSYNNAMNSYTAESNSISTAYQSAVNSYTQAMASYNNSQSDSGATTVYQNKPQGLFIDNNKHMDTDIQLNNKAAFDKYYKITTYTSADTSSFGMGESDKLWSIDFQSDQTQQNSGYTTNSGDWAKGLDITLNYKNAGQFNNRRISLHVRFYNPVQVFPSGSDIYVTNHSALQLFNNFESGGYGEYKNWSVDLWATYIDDGSTVNFGSSDNKNDAYISMASLSQTLLHDYDANADITTFNGGLSTAESIKGLSGVSNPFLNKQHAVSVHSDGNVYADYGSGTKGWGLTNGGTYVNHTNNDLMFVVVEADGNDQWKPISYTLDGVNHNLSKFDEKIIVPKGSSITFHQNEPDWSCVWALWIGNYSQTFGDVIPYSDYNPYSEHYKNELKNHNDALGNYMNAGVTYRLTGTKASFEIGNAYNTKDWSTGPNWFNFSTILVNNLPIYPPTPKTPIPPSKDIIDKPTQEPINPPTKEITPPKKVADISYHSNTVYRKNNAK